MNDTSDAKADRRRIVREMVAAAEALLGRKVPSDEAGDITCVLGRTWRRHTDEGPRYVPIKDAEIKLFCWGVALERLLDVEGVGGAAAVEQELGEPFTVDAVKAYMDRFWARFDPIKDEGEEP